ncbi:hypothetical protein FBUS_01858 [Fasciolopsis buskii]|uniref:Uncharacterized protein n=1 Tax=Fasciolopsis buskii TaxID=27845 RepID=A0A8E0VFS0_9TREM|nr:hypothetical protein FBUS_01858 [Fasciolopsis buski]
MRLELPDYVINRNLMKAIIGNNATYVKDVIRASPWLRDALLYKEANLTNFGIFEQTYRPPVLCLFTPFAHAMLWNSKSVIKTLKQMEADMYHPCYVADILEEGTSSYRVLKLPPIALCRPGDPGLSTAVESGYDIHGNIMVVTTIYRGNNAEDAVVRYRGYWDFCLGANKNHQNAQTITDLTGKIILMGYNTNTLLRQLDLCKLFSRYYHLVIGKGFQTEEDLFFASDLIRTLIRNGSSFNDPPVARNLYKALQELIQSENHSDKSLSLLKTVLRSAVLLAPDIEACREMKSLLLNEIIQKTPRDTLASQCARQIRSLLDGQFFRRNVQMLPCSDEVKLLIIQGTKT